ncbi:MAG: icmD [Gammaproteobacteria bacterium]|jgi:intracellular multiplication protein IcmD|nr:icmD [Gammaproteobacteria bacterium]
MKLNTKSMAKAAVYMAVAAGFFTMAAYADAVIPSPPTNSMGYVAATVLGSLGNVAQVISAVSYLAGFGFTIASFFKLKQHKDNPQQIPVTNGLAMLAIGAALIFAPSVFQMVGATLFGDTAKTAGVEGITTVPGQTN